MKDYKGLYREEKSYVPCFEHGAHFKYLHLVNALKELQLNLYNKNELESIEITESPIKNNNIILLRESDKKKTKQYKLKKYLLTENNENKRYNDIDNINENEENEKNEKSYNKYIRESKKELFKNSKINIKEKGVSKSIDKIKEKLPSINKNNNLNSLRNKSFNPQKMTERIIYNFDDDQNTSNNYNNNDLEIKEYNIRNKKYENNNNENEILNVKNTKKSKKKFESLDFLPKIKIFQKNQEKENENKAKYEERENNFQDNDLNISIEAKNKKSYLILQKSHKKLKKFFKNENLMNDSENRKSNKIINVNNKLKSIFETEKKIKSNKFLLNEKNKSSNKNYYFDTLNDDMAQQIYQLKKQLLINKKSKFAKK